MWGEGDLKVHLSLSTTNPSLDFSQRQDGSVELRVFFLLFFLEMMTAKVKRKETNFAGFQKPSNSGKRILRIALG